MAISSPESKTAPTASNRSTVDDTQGTANASIASARQNQPGLLLSLQPVQADTEDWLAKTAPRLHPPEADLSKFIEILRTLQQTVSTSDMTAATINANFIDSEITKNREIATKNTDAIRAQNKEIESSHTGKRVLSWIACIVGIFGAVITTIASFGMGVVLVGLALAELANNIIQEIKPPPLRKNEFGEDVPLSVSPTELILFLTMEDGVRTGKIRVIGFNADENTPGAITRKQYDEQKKIASMVITILIVVGTIVYSVASAAKSVATAAKTTTDVVKDGALLLQQASKAEITIKIAGAVTTLVGGLGGLAGSAISFVLAFANKNLSEMRILAVQIGAIIQSLQQQFDIQQDHFRSAMDFQGILRKLVADAMADFIQSSLTIAKNTRR